MNVGDEVEVLGQVNLLDERTGVVERIELGRVVVRFADGWRRFYNPEQLRVVEPLPAVKGAGL